MSKNKVLSYLLLASMLAGLTACGAMGGGGRDYRGSGSGIGSSVDGGKYGQ
jgi:predicted small secreted protein